MPRSTRSVGDVQHERIGTKATLVRPRSQRETVLIVCPYPRDKAAGQRLKYEQYIGDWEAAGFEVEISPFMSEAMWSVVHKPGHYGAKVFWTLIGILKRLRDLVRLPRYDLIYVFMYVVPLGNALFESIFRRLSRRMVFDLEDNRFLGADRNTSGLAQRLRGTSKTEYLVRSADHVITSSPALNDICLELNERRKCTYISSSIDTDRFVPSNRYTNAERVTIGWTGTFSTRPYLDLLRPVFSELRKTRDFRLLVIGNFEYEFPGMDLEVIQWSAENEVADLQKIDIGVYPLPMEEWVMGKSGLKAIQYMSFGLPCVASDISTVQQFIRDGENGLLVRTEDEWVRALTRLIDEPELRRTIGENARETVMAKFSKHVIKEQYLAVLNETISN